MSLTFNFTGTIEDNHGVLHTDPVFILTHYNKRADENTSGSLSRDSEGVFSFQEEPVTTNRQFYYQVQFWTNQTAMDDDKDPITFINNGNSNLYFQPETNPSTHANIRAACQDHFLSEILPQYVVTE